MSNIMQTQTLRLSSTLMDQIYSQDSTQMMNEFKQTGKILLKDKILLAPGNWNGLDFSASEISLAFKNTDWSDKYNYALIYDHEEKAINWLGNVLNIHMEGDVMLGDLEIFDENLAKKLTMGGAKLGISARVLGNENEKGAFIDFTYNNFSVVYDPACKSAYINLSKDKALEKIEELRQQLVELESGITTAGAVAGRAIGAATTNEKIKYPKKKKKDEDEELGAKFDKVISEIKDSLRKAHPDWDEEKITSTAFATAKARKIDENMSDLHLLKGGNNLSDSTMEKKEETKNEVVEEVKEEVVEAPAEKAEAEADNSDASAELSSKKLDLILKQVKELSAKIAKLEEVVKEETPAEEVAEEAETPAEEAEAPVEEAKLSEKATKKAMSIVDLSNDRNLARGYSAGDLELARELSEATRLR